MTWCQMKIILLWCFLCFLEGLQLAFCRMFVFLPHVEKLWKKSFAKCSKKISKKISLDFSGNPWFHAGWSHTMVDHFPKSDSDSVTGDPRVFRGFGWFGVEGRKQLGMLQVPKSRGKRTYPSWKYHVRPEKWMVGRWKAFWNGLF